MPLVFLCPPRQCRPLNSTFRSNPTPDDATGIAAFISSWRDGSAKPVKLDLASAQKKAQQRSMVKQKAKEMEKAEQQTKLKGIIMQLQAAAHAGDPKATKELGTIFQALQQQGMSPHMIQQMLASAAPGSAGAGSAKTLAEARARGMAGQGAAGAAASSPVVKVVAQLKAAAHAGDAKAQRDMAMSYAKGIPEAKLPQDVTKAAAYAKMGVATMMPKGAESGPTDPAVQELLADCYNLMQKHDDAFTWYSKAAEGGNKSAVYNLGQ